MAFVCSAREYDTPGSGGEWRWVEGSEEKGGHKGDYGEGAPCVLDFIFSSLLVGPATPSICVQHQQQQQKQQIQIQHTAAKIELGVRAAQMAMWIPSVEQWFNNKVCNDMNTVQAQQVAPFDELAFYRFKLGNNKYWP